MPPSRHRHETHHGAADRRLAAAGFADQAERLAGRKGQAHAVDGTHGADRPAQDLAADREMHLQVLDGEKRRALDRGARSFGGAPRREDRGDGTAWALRRSGRRTLCPPSMVREAGSSDAQRDRPAARPQRGWNEQPAAMRDGVGGWPGIGSSRPPRASSLGALFSKAAGIGMARSLENIARRSPGLDDAPAIHDRDALRDFGNHAKIVRHQNGRRARRRLAPAPAVPALAPAP